MSDKMDQIAEFAKRVFGIQPENENDSYVLKRDFSTEEREKLAEEGKALPDGSFPIVNKEDLKNAIKLRGNASDPGKAKRHIIKRARALGATDMLPDEWDVSKKDSDISDNSDTSETNVELRVPVAKSTDRGQIFGWAMFSEDPSAPGSGRLHIDSQDDVVTVDELEKAAYEFNLESRSGGVMHKVKDTATLIESTVFTDEKIEKMGIPEGTIPNGAWWVGFQIHDDEVKKLVKDGSLTEFSIEGSAIRKEIE